MNIEEVLDLLDELLDKSWSLPLSGGRCVVDAEKVRDFIDDIRINLPNEIKQAKAIVNDRSEILEAAHREAESIIRKAEERAKALIAQEEIIKISQSKASEILAQTQMQSREIRQAAQAFSDDILRVTEEAITNSLNEVRQTRQALRSKSKRKS
ncbi:MAG: ATPase [Oscillospiraceae bacterium]|jgi:cell division septum initiation protein DivIVA